MNQRAYHDLDHIVSLIQSFEALPEQQLTAATIHKYQKRLDDIAAIYQDDERVGSRRFVLYELQAMLLNARGEKQLAIECLDKARAIMGEDRYFISDAANTWDIKDAVQREYVNHVEEAAQGTGLGLMKRSKATLKQLENDRIWRWVKVTYMGISIVLCTAIGRNAYEKSKSEGGYYGIGYSDGDPWAAFWPVVFTVLTLWAIYRFFLPRLYHYLKPTKGN
jgi:hypothetical protein